MKNKAFENGGLQPALLFIPDISGFTRFVSEVEINHSQHIIEELLEILIESNEIGLEVSEIEGDAILFYRFGNAPTAAELLTQVQRMFVRFHAHLKKYHTHRICNCGACKTAHDLTLKFVAHYGDITMNTVKQYHKLFGKEVIVAHRLMKNSIEHHEYAMFTHNLVQACPQWVDIDTAAWAAVQKGNEEYDSGKVSYCYLPLAPLMGLVPELTVEDYSIPGVKAKVIETEAIVEAPLEMVFNVVSDLPWRSKWIPGSLPEVADINSELAQAGQTHRCLADGPVIVAHGFEASENVITFTETDQQRTYCVIYTLAKLDEGRTRVQSASFIRKNFFKELIFKLFVKKKLEKVYYQAWANLNGYCQGLLEQGKEHPYRVVLDNRQAVAV
ncbi:MAG: DUF2652 domain-containing protein [Phaeodactylibacter sp.]|nr:DUF2652 domain-containing protein [Phaeodactylibacter sp.]MCB9295330.1 DUF2652 domain-containing protein [Lewinellaceae bacterium]